MSHSTEFIADMKSLLEQERTTLTKEVGATGDYPEYGRNEEDNVTEMADYQASKATENTLEERLGNVNAALERIEQGTYGVTTDGETIPEDRLQANPAADSVVKKDDQ